MSLITSFVPQSSSCADGGDCITCNNGKNRSSRRISLSRSFSNVLSRSNSSSRYSSGTRGEERSRRPTLFPYLSFSANACTPNPKSEAAREASDGACTIASSSDESNLSDMIIKTSTVINIHQHRPELEQLHCERPAENECDASKQFDNFDNDYECYNCGCDNISSVCLSIMSYCHHNKDVRANRNTHSPLWPNKTPKSNLDEELMEIECSIQSTCRETIDNHCDDAKEQSTTSLFLLPQTSCLPLGGSNLHPSAWMQRPLLLVPTPESGMIIRRIRRVLDPCYFDFPQQEFFNHHYLNASQLQLPINNGKEHPLHSLVTDFETPLFAGTVLFRIRGTDTSNIYPFFPTKDETTTKDETSSREGSGSNNTSFKQRKTDHDYFAKLNRKFQMVIRGKFLKSDVVMADCVSGLLLDRSIITSKSSPAPSATCPAKLTCSVGSGAKEKYGSMNIKNNRYKLSQTGRNDENLPPKWVLRAAVKVAGLFSPRMDADLECVHPRILSPLGSVAQTIYVSTRKDTLIEGTNINPLDGSHSEPHPYSNASLVHGFSKTSQKSNSTDISNLVQYRKRVFDTVYDAHLESSSTLTSQSKPSPCFDPNVEYTFEFLQHLVDYNNLSIDLGIALGKIRLAGALRGQPVRFITAARKKNHHSKISCEIDGQVKLENLDCLWSFDLWHEYLHVGE